MAAAPPKPRPPVGAWTKDAAPRIQQALACLKLQPGASERDLRYAFHRRALECHPDKGGGTAEFLELSDAYTLLAEAALQEHHAAGTADRAAGSKEVVVGPGRWGGLAAEIDANRTMILHDGFGDGRLFLERFSGAKICHILRPRNDRSLGNCIARDLGPEPSLKQMAVYFHQSIVAAIANGRPLVLDMAAKQQQHFKQSGLLCKLRFYLDRIRQDVVKYLRTGDPATAGQKPTELPPSAAAQNRAVHAIQKRKPARPPAGGPDSPYVCFAQSYRPTVLQKLGQPARERIEVDALVRKGWEGLDAEQKRKYEAEAVANRTERIRFLADFDARTKKWAAELAAAGPSVKAAGPMVSKAFLKANFKPWLMVPDGLFIALITGSLWQNEGYRPLFAAAGRLDDCPAESCGRSLGSFVVLCDAGVPLPYELRCRMPSVTLASGAAPVCDGGASAAGAMAKLAAKAALDKQLAVVSAELSKLATDGDGIGSSHQATDAVDGRPELKELVERGQVEQLILDGF